jgi:hypothetical protein
MPAGTHSKRDVDMKKPAVLGVFLVFATSAALFVAARAQQQPASVAIDPDDIGGVVRGPNGPEAGVWVIAETRDLPVRYIKSVVTDDQGRFVVPDLPKARYSVWARGYGLVDSDKTTSEPGRIVNLTAKAAPDEKAAAHYYPAIYWYSMLHIPTEAELQNKDLFRANITQRQWIGSMKNIGCVGCHQLGNCPRGPFRRRWGRSSRARTRGTAVCSRGRRAR